MFLRGFERDGAKTSGFFKLQKIRTGKNIVLIFSLAFFLVLYIMDNMLEVNKNLKDQIKDTSSLLAPYENGSFRLGSYGKTNKLISALYMVTDIMDKEEPLRNKLRGLGTNIISDIHLIYKGQSLYNQINNEISETLSFLEIASSVNIISEMNSGILTKEFIELRKSIIEITPKNNQVWLEEFITSSPDKGRREEGFKYDPSVLKDSSPWQGSKMLGKERGNSKGQGTRIGVQKGSTLLQALSKVKVSRLGGQADRIRGEKTDVLKGKRREEIISIIKDKMKNSPNFDGMTITDIKSIGQNLPTGETGVLVSCGEKTIQRELVSMVSDGVLEKTGSKRWSRYSIK
jgi:hypothetical protein